MLCEFDTAGNPLLTWALLTFLGLVSQLIMSGWTFYEYYHKVSYEKWYWKTNAEFPSPESIRGEIIQRLRKARPISPHISPHLPIAPRTSPHLPEGEDAAGRLARGLALHRRPGLSHEARAQVDGD